MKNKKFQYTGNNVLNVMSAYAVNRNNAVENLLRKHLGLDTLVLPKKILEFGAGKGEFINRFIGHHHLQTYAIELDDDYLTTLSRHHIAFKEITRLDEQMDFIYLIDVLEHIRDDEQLLHALHKKLTPGGKLFIYVPARMELYSPFDRKIGHKRRYHKKELATKVRRGEFCIDVIRYHDLLGYFATYYNKLLSPNGNLNPRMVQLYDTILVPVTNVLERIVPAPIGKSLYVTACKWSPINRETQVKQV